MDDVIITFVVYVVSRCSIVATCSGVPHAVITWLPMSATTETAKFRADNLPRATWMSFKKWIRCLKKEMFYLSAWLHNGQSDNYYRVWTPQKSVYTIKTNRVHFGLFPSYSRKHAVSVRTAQSAVMTSHIQFSTEMWPLDSFRRATLSCNVM